MDGHMEVKNYQFIIPLTEEQKRKYDSRRRALGLTSQGLLKKKVLEFIGEAGNDEHTDS